MNKNFISKSKIFFIIVCMNFIHLFSDTAGFHVILFPKPAMPMHPIRSPVVLPGWQVGPTLRIGDVERTATPIQQMAWNRERFNSRSVQPRPSRRGSQGPHCNGPKTLRRKASVVGSSVAGTSCGLSCVGTVHGGTTLVRLFFDWCSIRRF